MNLNDMTDRIAELERQLLISETVKEAVSEGRDNTISWFQERIESLTKELGLAVSALGKVQAFVKDLEPYADQGTTLHPALYEACMVYERLK